MKQVTFIDQARIKVKAGRGGDGKMGFHKEKYVEHGGPSGGRRKEEKEEKRGSRGQRGMKIIITITMRRQKIK